MVNRPTTSCGSFTITTYQYSCEIVPGSVGGLSCGTFWCPLVRCQHVGAAVRVSHAMAAFHSACFASKILSLALATARLVQYIPTGADFG